MTQLPAVVTIGDLATSATINATALFEAAMTVGSVGTSVQVPLGQLATTVIQYLGTSITSSLGVVGVLNGGTGTGTAFGQGAVIFANQITGEYGGDNLNFFWSSVNHQLGIGVGGNPAAPLDISIGPDLPPATFSGVVVHVTGGNGLSTGPLQLMDGFGVNGSVVFRRALGTSGGPAAVITDTALGSIIWRGFANAYSSTASVRISGISGENWNATSWGGYFVVATTLNNTTTAATERFRIAGGAALGTTVDPGVGNFIAANYLNSGGFTRVSTNFGVVSSTTLVDITGLSAALLTGNSYFFESCLYVTAGSTGGTKIAVACAGGATNIVYDMEAYAAGALVGQGRATAAAGVITASSSAVVPTVRIIGTVTAQNAGNMTMQIAQVAATTTSTIALAGSTLKVFQIS